MNLVNEGVLPPNEPDDRDERIEEREVAHKRETLAEIVQALRDGSIYDENGCFDSHEIADRLEDAWKREREELDKRISDLEAYAKLWTGRADELRLKCDEFYAKARPVGNAAAMREALVKIRRELNCYCNDCTLPDRMTEDPPDYTCLRDSLLEIERIVNAALSAPARNCDRFADETDAQIAFLNEVWLISVTKETALERDRFENWTDEMRSRYAKWLFATTERKGEGDENK